MRTTFSRLLAQTAQNDERVLLLTGDHGYALFDEFRRVRPKQFLNCGVAEQNMVGVAAGLAKSGFLPIVYGLSSFVPIRVLEQIKIDVCYESLPVAFVGDGAGLVYSQLGASHQSTEDLAVLRAIPNMHLFSPADRHELAYCFTHMMRLNKPAYLRFGKADRGDVHNTQPEAPLGALLQVREGQASCAFLATGSMVRSATELAARLGDVPVWSVPVLTGFDSRQLLDIGRRHRRVFVFEEHSVIGGLGSAVAEVVAEFGGCQVTRIGIEARFSELCGSYDSLLNYHGLSLDSMEARVNQILAADRH